MMKFMKKAKLLYLKKFLFENTDEENGVTMQQICDYLRDNDISAERKSIYSDIDILRKLGFDIISYREGNGRYYKLASRDFELSELKLLIDSVRYSQFITPNKKEKLVEKISKLTSIHNATELNRQVSISNHSDKWNESIFYNVDSIYRAINKNKKIAFHYFSWNQFKEKHFKGNKALFSVSPFKLIINDEKYYLLAYDDYQLKIKTYRIDRMKNIEIMDRDRIGHDFINKIDAEHYTAKVFGMFGGEERNVKLRCKNELAGMIIDKFGMDTHFSLVDEDKFEIIVKIVPSHVFYGWVLGTAGGVELIEPRELKKEMIKMVGDVIGC